MRRDVKRGRGANARAEETDGMFASFALQRVERSVACGRDPFQAAPDPCCRQTRIIHSPRFL